MNIMKKILLSTVIFLFAYSSYAQFVGGNLAVLRFGDGSAALSNAMVPMFIDEYNTSGTLVSTLAIPTTTSAPNFRMFASPKSTTGAADLYRLNNAMSLSSNGSYISVSGYDAASGTLTASVPKVIGRIDANKNINTATTVNVTAADVRGTQILDNGNFFYVNTNGGTNAGNNYIGLGNDIAAGTLIATGTVRSYFATSSALYYGPGSNAIRFWSPIPTTATALSQFTATGLNDPTSMIVLDSNSDGTIDMIYVCDQGTTTTDYSTFTVRKIQLISGVWTAKGSIVITGARSLTGRIVGTDVELYVATWGNPAASQPSKLLKIVDVGASSSSITGLTPTVLVTAADDKTKFHGVTFTPGTNVSTYFNTLPVKMSLLGIKNVAGYAQLDWTTEAEKNSSHFDVLRSGNGKDFNAIGTVKSAGNSDSKIKYNFVDKTPLSATSYYQLKQVDLNGQFEDSKILSFKSSLKESKFEAFFDKSNSLNVSFFSDVKSSTSIVLYDTKGSAVAKIENLAQEGQNNFVLNSAELEQGVYILKVYQKGLIGTSKVLKSY
jgi:hypothetical protein